MKFDLIMHIGLPELFSYQKYELVKIQDSGQWPASKTNKKA